MFRLIIFIIICLSSIISAGIFYVLSKEKFLVRCTIFFGAIYYLTLSIVKLYLDGPRLTLYESFWDALPSTCILYGTILMILSVVVPFAYFIVLRNNAVRFVEMHVSLDVILFVVGNILFGKLSHLVYITVFVLSTLATFVRMISSAERLSFFDKKELLLMIKKYWLVLLLPIYLIMFYYPNELYLTNINEFSNPYHEFVLILLMAMVVVFLGESIILFVLPTSCFKPWVYSMFAFSICSYVQATFFNGRMNAMIGQHQEWDFSRFIINAAIWIIVFVITMILGVKKRVMENVAVYSSAFFVLFLSITIVSLGIQKSSDLSIGKGEFTTENSLVLANQNNVLVFVLDLYDSRIFDELVEIDPSFSEPLEDFTYYARTSSRHPYTAFSIPYLLTGSQWREDEGQIFYQYAYEGDTLLSDLYNNGIDLGIYTWGAYISEDVYPMIGNYEEGIVRESNIFNTISIMSKASFYKVMPFVIKENYFYYTGDISEMVNQGIVWSIDNDVPFYNRIVNEGLVVSDNIESAFRFYHMRGDHYPFYLSENIQEDKTLTQATIYSQAKGSMKVVYSFIEELKAIGLYDDTTIIITSDHGNLVHCDTESKLLNDTSSPILFVKKAGEHREKMEYNYSQVSHTEMLPTILDAYGIDYSRYGERLEDVDPTEVRERYFGYYSSGEGVVKGTVVGDCRDLGNWIVD